MDTLYNVNIEVALVPVIHKTIPRITYGYDDTVINTMDLEIPCLVSLDHDFTKGTHSFWVEFLNKDYTDYPDKNPVLQPHTYLGWNGRWVLEFETPVFTWIHRLEDLGWLYSA